MLVGTIVLGVTFLIVAFVFGALDVPIRGRGTEGLAAAGRVVLRAGGRAGGAMRAVGAASRRAAAGARRRVGPVAARMLSGSVLAARTGLRTVGKGSREFGRAARHGVIALRQAAGRTRSEIASSRVRAPASATVPPEQEASPAAETTAAPPAEAATVRWSAPPAVERAPTGSTSSHGPKAPGAGERDSPPVTRALLKLVVALVLVAAGTALLAVVTGRIGAALLARLLS